MCGKKIFENRDDRARGKRPREFDNFEILSKKFQSENRNSFRGKKSRKNGADFPVKLRKNWSSFKKSNPRKKLKKFLVFRKNNSQRRKNFWKIKFTAEIAQRKTNLQILKKMKKCGGFFDFTKNELLFANLAQP